jgi:hypothetical protein
LNSIVDQTVVGRWCQLPTKALAVVEPVAGVEGSRVDERFDTFMQR